MKRALITGLIFVMAIALTFLITVVVIAVHREYRNTIIVQHTDVGTGVQTIWRWEEYRSSDPRRAPSGIELFEEPAR